MELIESEMLPSALAMGVPYELFWNELNPARLKPFGEAYKMKLKDENFKMWLEGQYMLSALSATIGNMFKKRGSKPIEYTKEPFDIFSDKTIIVNDEMSEEEKIIETEKLFAMLEGMQAKFEKNHKQDGIE